MACDMSRDLMRYRFIHKKVESVSKFPSRKYPPKTILPVLECFVLYAMLCFCNNGNNTSLLCFVKISIKIYLSYHGNQPHNTIRLLSI